MSVTAWRAACEACGWSRSWPTYSVTSQAAWAHSEQCPEASTVIEPVPGDADVSPAGGQLPLIDSTDAATREVGWVAREARALMSVDDPERRERFLARKRALLDFIDGRQR